jgi:hypothetical protein
MNKNIILIKTIPGGSRGHIISISKKGRLTYRIGSISDLKSYNTDFITYDEKYKTTESQFNQSEVLELEGLTKEKKALSFKDELVVKDSWQYYLYLNGELIAFGYEKNFKTYPSNLKFIINMILKETGKLNKIPGMS